MKIRALKAFTIRDIETGNLTSIAYGGIAEVSDTVGTSLISDGLAEAYTLVNPTGSVNISSNGTVDVAEYATAVVNVPGVTPTGTIEITSNGTVDVTNYATAEVNVDYTTVNFNLSGLTKTTTKALGRSRRLLAATTVAPEVGSDPQSEHALFAGGYYYNATSALVDAYDADLTMTTPTALSQARDGLTATTLAPTGGSNPQSGHALFGGGWFGDSPSSVVDAYDSRLTKTTPTALSEARNVLTATTIVPTVDSDPQSEHALFGGGYNGNSVSSVVDAYDSSLTRTTPTVLSQARRELAATTVAPVGDSGYALFGGGYDGNSSSSVVDAYDSSLTRTTPTVLSQGKSALAATTVVLTGDSNPQSVYALFGGGKFHNSSVVDAYDTSLTRITPTALSQARDYLAATSLAPAGGSGYALFGGGYDEEDLSFSSAVDVYGSQNYKVQVFPGTKYSFNGSEELVSDTWQEINISGDLIGYIKIKSTNVVG